MGTRFRVVLAGAVLGAAVIASTVSQAQTPAAEQPHPPAQNDGVGHQHEQHRDGCQRHRRDPRHQVVHT